MLPHTSSCQIVEACWTTRESNGGLLEVPHLLRLVNRRRGGQADPVTDDDALRAIKKLKARGQASIPTFLAPAVRNCPCGCRSLLPPLKVMPSSLFLRYFFPFMLCWSLICRYLAVDLKLSQSGGSNLFVRSLGSSAWTVTRCSPSPRCGGQGLSLPRAWARLMALRVVE